MSKADRRLVMHTIDPEEFRRDLDDEKLRALIGDGWHVVTSCVLTDPVLDQTRYALILEPETPPGRVEVPLWAFLALSVFAGAELLQVGIGLWGVFGG